MDNGFATDAEKVPCLVVNETGDIAESSDGAVNYRRYVEQQELNRINADRIMAITQNPCEQVALTQWLTLHPGSEIC